jgi:hypothetical protein
MGRLDALFARSVNMAAESAVETARELSVQAESDRANIGRLGRIAGSALRVFGELVRRPIADSVDFAKTTNL